MPPKNIIKWEDSTLYISDLNGVFHEMGKIDVDQILEPSEKISPIEINATKFTCSFRARWKTKKQLGQLIGLLKRPKLTYKTNMDYINKRRYNGHKRPKK